AGVRDEEVERLVDRGANLGLVADVAGLDRRAVDDSLETGGIAGEQREAGAFGGEPLGDRAADPRAGAGDDGVGAVESPHRASQAASTRCSFSGSSPAGGSSGASPLRTQASVSATVSASGRLRRPAATARSAGTS